MRKLGLLSATMLLTLSLGACTLFEKEEISSEEQEVVEDVCGENFELEMNNASICLNTEGNEGFVQQGKYEVVNTEYNSNNEIFVKEISKEEYSELAELIESDGITATTFNYQEVGIENINGIEFIKLSHGYFPIGTDTTDQFDEENASISGYSYIYSINEENLLLFDSEYASYNQEWIEEYIDSIK